MTDGNSRTTPSPLIQLIDLTRRARHASSAAELRFLLVNDSHILSAYRQAALWLSGTGVQALSGVVQIEANAPYVLWLDKLMAHCARTLPAHGRIDPETLPDEFRETWPDWLPAHGYWLPIAATKDTPEGGLLLARDLPWADQEGLLLAEWTDAWTHSWGAMHKAAWSWRVLWSRLRHPLAALISPSPENVAADLAKPWWKRRKALWAYAVIGILLFPVRLTVLAPGELVPANPDIIRAPVDGVVDVFYVQPNQKVKSGQALFDFDGMAMRSQLEVARQALATAEAEYRQTLQLAINDPKAKAMLSSLAGKIEEKRAEAAYLQEKMTRSRVVSPRDGVVLFDDPTEWIGRPVTVGERIMRVVNPEDVEVEAWVGVADAIPLDDDANVSLHLDSSPLSPVKARLRYFAHDAIQRPEGNYAYRLRASLLEKTGHRVGLKGTVRISGHWVPLSYWALRRPWAGLRSLLGW